MNNFKPGGQKPPNKFLGGRPREDAKYGAKKSFGGKPSFGNDRGGSRGGDRGGFGGNRDGERREMTMHKATCSTCGKGCEVPFKPDGSKPVLCSECFGKNRSDDRNGVDRRERFSNDRPQRAPERKFDSPRPPRQDSPDLTALVKQVATLESKINQILDLVKTPTPKTHHRCAH